MTDTSPGERLWTLAIWSVDEARWVGLGITASAEGVKTFSERFKANIPWPFVAVEIASELDADVSRVLDGIPAPVFSMSDVARAMWWVEGLYEQRQAYVDAVEPSS